MDFLNTKHAHIAVLMKVYDELCIEIDKKPWSRYRSDSEKMFLRFFIMDVVRRILYIYGKKNKNNIRSTVDL